MDFRENKVKFHKIKQNSSMGQAYLEFMIVLPLLLFVLVGVFDLGRVYFSAIGLVSAAREGARYLSAFPDDVSNDVEAFYNTKQIAIQEATGAGISLQGAGITVSCTNSDEDSDNCDSGSPAIVTVTHDFDLVLGWVIPGPISITRSAQMIVP
jgi:Flp pilus assembly protein TadG